MHTTIDKLKINYEETGQGQDNVLILHGWGADIESFRPIIDDYSKDYKVWAIDFPGFGDSDEPEEVWDVSRYADFVEAFMDKFDIKQPILIGHSFGGRVSIKLSTRERLKIEKLILIDSAGVKPKRELSYYIRVYGYKFIKKLSTLPVFSYLLSEFIDEYRQMVSSSDYKSASEKMKAILSVVVNEDLTGYFAHINADTLLVWGEDDTATPLSDGKLMEEKIPNSALVSFKGAGHYSYLEKQKEYLLISREFMKGGDL